jgi:hypothetical protein
MATFVAIVLPCAFALRICRHQLSRLDVCVAIAVCVLGLAAGAIGTYHAVMSILSKY